MNFLYSNERSQCETFELIVFMVNPLGGRSPGLGKCKKWPNIIFVIVDYHFTWG